MAPAACTPTSRVDPRLFDPPCGAGGIVVRVRWPSDRRASVLPDAGSCWRPVLELRQFEVSALFQKPCIIILDVFHFRHFNKTFYIGLLLAMFLAFGVFLPLYLIARASFFLSRYCFYCIRDET